MDVTLSLAADSAAIATDASGNIIGLSAADIQPYLFGVSGVNLATDTLTSTLTSGISCGDNTFVSTGCAGGPPYDYSFFPSSFAFATDFDLTAGNSITGALGSFTPTGGTAPAGTYSLVDVDVSIIVFDDSLANDPDIAIIDLADTSNAFTRTVVSSAPEPGTWALMLAGLVLAGGAASQKSRVRRTEP